MLVHGEAKLDNKMYEITELDKYINNPDAFLSGHVAIRDGDYILPVIPQNSPKDMVGIEVGNPISRIHLPNNERKEEYSTKNMVDFSNVQSMVEWVNAQDAIVDMEKEILTNPTNTSQYNITEEDAPAMRLLKEAVNCKNINLDNYEHRFGSNYNNDKRIFNKHNVSLGMLERMADALDMKLSVTLQDTSEEVPNPIGKVITVDITGGNNNE